jgi:hypothetical protein
MNDTRYVVATFLLAAIIGCGGGKASPTSPTALRNKTPDPVSVLVSKAAYDPSGAVLSQAINLVFPEPASGAMAITFPPRNEPLEFRNALEAKYRDGLRRGAVSTFVDAEGTVVWTKEYLRY